jgi:glycosyltransferase involved in cell wall biosynthesis
MTDPFLSIVTISFNQARHLRQCVESVLSQKDDDVEYIVVDPGSADGSREILEEYASDIDHLILEPDTGPADGLNKGFARARGRYGYFINSDDFLLPGAINRLRELWRTHAEADVLLCGAWMVDSEGHPLREARAMPLSVSALLHGRTIVVQQGLSFKLQLLWEIDGFNAMNRSCWDFEMLCAFVARKAHFCVCRQRIGVFRLHGDGLSGGGGGDVHWERYHADHSRIYEFYMGRAPGIWARIETEASVWIKYLQNLPVAIAQARDGLYREQLMRRWDDDRKDASISAYPAKSREDV